MNILDENISAAERMKLNRWRIPVRQIGDDVGRGGMSDDEIVARLHTFPKPTFFTRDRDYWSRVLCHRNYCIVFSDVADNRTAEFTRRVLRHVEFDTSAKRLGAVLCATLDHHFVFRRAERKPVALSWTRTPTKL